MRGVMSSITMTLVLAGFVGYGAAWYFVSSKATLLPCLFLAAVVTGIYWVAEQLYFPATPQGGSGSGNAASLYAELAKMGINRVG